MRGTVLYLALIASFCLSTLAQTSNAGQSGAGEQSSQNTAGSKKSSKRNSRKTSEHQVTGCLRGTNSDGSFTLTNGRYKKGLSVGGSKSLKNHVGHEVTLFGAWANPDEVGASRHLNVTRIKMKSETCTATATAGKKKSKKPANSPSPPTT